MMVCRVGSKFVDIHFHRIQSLLDKGTINTGGIAALEEIIIYLETDCCSDSQQSKFLFH
jgi:hypothetical protein